MARGRALTRGVALPIQGRAVARGRALPIWGGALARGRALVPELVPLPGRAVALGHAGADSTDREERLPGHLPPRHPRSSRSPHRLLTFSDVPSYLTCRHIAIVASRRRRGCLGLLRGRGRSGPQVTQGQSNIVAGLRHTARAAPRPRLRTARSLADLPQGPRQPQPTHVNSQGRPHPGEATLKLLSDLGRSTRGRSDMQEGFPGGSSPPRLALPPRPTTEARNDRSSSSGQRTVSRKASECPSTGTTRDPDPLACGLHASGNSGDTVPFRVPAQRGRTNGQPHECS